MSALQLPFLHPDHPFRETFQVFLHEHGLDFNTWPALREKDATRAEAIAEAFGIHLLEDVLPSIRFLTFKKLENNLLIGISIDQESAELLAFELPKDVPLSIESLPKAVRAFQSIKPLVRPRVELVYEWLEKGGRPTEKAFFDALVQHVPQED